MDNQGKNNKRRRYYRHNYKYRYSKGNRYKYYYHHRKPYYYFYKKKKNHNKQNMNDQSGNILLSPVNALPIVDINENESSNQLDESTNILEFVFEEEEDMKKKQKKISPPKLPVIKTALGIIVLVAIVFSVSFAYFNYYQEDSRQADISSGEVYVRVPENKATLTLTKTYPRTAAEARSKTDNYVDFTVEAKNTSPKKVLFYEINIADGEEIANKSRIDRENIKVDLQEKINDEYVYVQQAVSLSDFSFTSSVPTNTTTQIEKEYRLRIWMSEDVLISDTMNNRTYTQSQFANLYANYSIEVNSYDGYPSAISVINSVAGLETTYDGKVYSGATVNNYVMFNNEQWRIIGVYGDNLKIIRNTPLDTKKTLSGSAWEDSELEQYLNQVTEGGYYYSLSATAKQMIADGTWYPGASSGSLSANDAYGYVRLSPAITRKVGLIGVYEYLYAAENDGTCWTATTGSNYNTSCAAKDWLFPVLVKSNIQGATINLSGSTANAFMIITMMGNVADPPGDMSSNISPVVYLKSNVTITGGNGQSGNAYTLGYTGS